MPWKYLVFSKWHYRPLLLCMPTWKITIHFSTSFVWTPLAKVFSIFNTLLPCSNILCWYSIKQLYLANIAILACIGIAFIITGIIIIPIMQYYNRSGQKTPDSSWGRLSEALGNWGSGNLEGGGFGERVGTGEVSLQATWDRGGRILSQLGGFQVSRRGLKGEQRGGKGDQQG